MKRYWRLYRPHYWGTQKLALPVVIAQIGQITVGLADNMMIGQLGKTPLAAASFANTLFALPLIFGMGYAMAVTPLIGKAHGEKNHSLLHSLRKGAYLSNGSMAALLTLVCIVLYFAMPSMQQPANIIGASQSYFSIIGASIIPLMFFMSSKQIAEGLSDTKTAMRITLFANALNIFGNYVLIYGKFGMPALGLNGAGISTLSARIIMAIWMYLAVSKLPAFKKIINQTTGLISSASKITKLGLPMGLHMFSEASAFIMAGIMMGWISETGLAAHQIVISLSTIGFMIYQGLGAGTTIRISQFSARQVTSHLRNASQASIQMASLMVIVISCLFITLKNWLPTLFTNDAEVINIASQLIVLMVIFQLFDAYQIIYASILRGLADATIPGIITMVSYFLIAIPFSYWAAFMGGYNENGIWFGFPLGLGICALLFYIRVRILINKQKKKLELTFIK